VVESDFFAIFAGFLKGVLRKVRVWLWCFDGVIVVGCVVDVVFWQRAFER
jgi:hypothetical protein